MKTTKTKTRLYRHIIDNYGSFPAFCKALQNYAGMPVFPTDYKGGTTLNPWARGKCKPSTTASLRKWDIVCDFIQHETSERPTMEWLEIGTEHPQHEPIGVQTTLELPEWEATKTPIFSGMEEARQHLFAAIDYILTNKN